MRFMRIAIATIISCSIMSCGMLGNTAIQPPVEDKDFVAPAKEAVLALKADYVVTKGLFAIVQQNIDNFLYVDDMPRLGRVRWNKVREEFTSCWQAPLDAVENAEQRAVNAASAATHFQSQGALHEVKAVQDTGWNAVQRVKACPQSLTDQVEGLPRNATDEAKAWTQGKMEILSSTRVLLLGELPARLEKLGGTAVDTPATVGRQLAEAEAYKQTLQQIGNDAVRSSNARQINELNRIKTETTGLGQTVSNDASALGTMATEMTTKLTEGIATFGK